MTTTGAKTPPKTSVRETLISITIALVMAFVFRGFVIEAFVIPTGSMAPTLNGAHMRFLSPQSGMMWDANPRDMDPRTREPYAIQSPGGARGDGMDMSDPQSPRQFNPIVVRDPMTEQRMERRNVTVSGGDRIFVMKYLYSIYDPQRYDVVVFKNPAKPPENYIKRLLGLPGEMVALIDGDVFARPRQAGDEAEKNPWKLPGWVCTVKPERAQRAMWQPVFSSDYAPLNDMRDGVRWFTAPWRSDEAGWEIGSRQNYVYSGTGATTLAWDFLKRPVQDFYPYAEPLLIPGRYTVSDLRMSAGVRPAGPDLKVSAVIKARGHEFRADIDGGTVQLRMRAAPRDGAVGEWSLLGSGTLKHPLRQGEVTNLDFWHSDQTLRLFCEDELVASGTYTWTPAQRVQNAMGISLDQALETDTSMMDNPAPPAQPRWEFSGGGFTLYRVSLMRDIHYQAVLYHTLNEFDRPHSMANQPAKATHPRSTAILTDTQYFVCGDNSPMSLDARLWDAPSPWVAGIDPTPGVVHRDLLIGKAFFVYFPAPYQGLVKWVPNFGRMRFIW